MAISFNDWAALRVYINTFLLENHANEITANQHNNIENGLLDFIIKSAENWNKAKVIGSTGSYVATSEDCYLIFKPTAIGTVTLTNNRWNKWIIVNQTGVSKQLVGGINKYFSPTGSLLGSVPARSAITIAKGTDNLWYNTTGASSVISAGVSFGKLQIIVGVTINPNISPADFYIQAGQTSFVLDVAGVMDGSVFITTSGNEAPETVEDIEVASYEVIYNQNDVIIDFTQGYGLNDILIIHYAVAEVAA